MLKTSSIAAALLAAGSSGALAQQMDSSTRMSCTQARAYVQSHGGVVLGTGGMTYDRFVSTAQFCEPTQRLKTAFAPTTDNPQCMIGFTCIEPFTAAPDATR
ncbi:hypothetical protein [Enterovirga sp.]|uniref:hypothetical protein n=1 Tax=Enterovirga sp. TaxID=2026350 RepID=UPI002BBBBA7B|nr:hypothetical protein [Enterovirga sp.]HMO30122.1 hypothetical protein [Enterovirga sp.]